MAEYRIERCGRFQDDNGKAEERTQVVKVEKSIEEDYSGQTVK